MHVRVPWFTASRVVAIPFFKQESGSASFARDSVAPGVYLLECSPHTQTIYKIHLAARRRAKVCSSYYVVPVDYVSIVLALYLVLCTSILQYVHVQKLDYMYIVRVQGTCTFYTLYILR